MSAVQYKEDTYGAIKALNYTIDAIIECYKGNCRPCRKYSFTCQGTATRHWKKEFLPVNEEFCI